MLKVVLFLGMVCCWRVVLAAVAVVVGVIIKGRLRWAVRTGLVLVRLGMGLGYLGRVGIGGESCFLLECFPCFVHGFFLGGCLRLVKLGL